MTIAALTRARDRLIAAGRENQPLQVVCSEIVGAMHDVTVFDRCSVMTTDPATLLPSGGIVEGFDSHDCAPFWDNELVDPDYNKFTQLARSNDHVATLFEAVDGDLLRSPRYRKLYQESAAEDELRTVFVAGQSCLAVGVFVRPAGSGPFPAGELASVRDLLPVATRVLRRALGRRTETATGAEPTVVVLDGQGNLTATTQGGRKLLADLRTSLDDDGLPSIIRAAATRARWSRSTSHVTTRIHDGSGRWLRLHVTPMEGEVGSVAVVIETARPGDLTQVLLDSYGLTQRETEVALMLARGLSSKEIAAELMLSVHTIRDHIKAIYEKADVNTRGELVANLFSNHVLDHFHASVTHLG